MPIDSPLYLWPCDTYAVGDEERDSLLTFMSDDYEEIAIPDDCEDVEAFVERKINERKRDAKEKRETSS